MADSLRVLFLQGLAATSEGFTHDYFVRTFWMLLICLFLVFFVTLVLLAFTSLYRSDRTRALVDTDLRIRLSAGWAVEGVFLAMAALLVWIWYRVLRPSGADAMLPLWQWACHWTTLVVLFFIWLALYLGSRNACHRAQRAASPG